MRYLMTLLAILCLSVPAQAQNLGELQLHGTIARSKAEKVSTRSLGVSYGVGQLGPIGVSLGADTDHITPSWLTVSVGASLNGPRLGKHVTTNIGVELNDTFVKRKIVGGTAGIVGVVLFNHLSVNGRFSATTIEAQAGINVPIKR